MSYSESNGEVTLKMSREDYEKLMTILRLFTLRDGSDKEFLIDRLNQGNPNYTPYRTGESE